MVMATPPSGSQRLRRAVNCENFPRSLAVPGQKNPDDMATEVGLDQGSRDVFGIFAAIHHEVHAPTVIDVAAGGQGLTLADGALVLAALAHRQIGQLGHALDAFVVHLPAFQGQ